VLAAAAAGAWLLAATEAAAQPAPIPSGNFPVLPPSGLYPAAATQSALTGLHVRAVAEVGNEPTIPGGAPERYRDQVGAMPLVNTQITGRLPYVGVHLEQGLVPQVGVRLSGEISQVIRDPVSNPDLEDAFQQRQTWRLSGGSAQRPLFVAQIKDAYMQLADPERSGGIQMGQFRVPFGFDRFATAFPPLAIAPEETPMSDIVGSLGAINYQASTLAYRHDIGLMVFGRSGDARYYAGTFNGSGPNRLDDNGDKDFFARFDWQPSPTEEFGFSGQVGNDIGYPGGLGPRQALPPVKVFRRHYGVHGRFKLMGLEVQGEWQETFSFGTVPGGDFEAAPRRGWYLESGGSVTPSDRVYTQYGNFHDPRTPDGRPYQSHQVSLGTVHAFAPGLTWRTEVQYRWEYLGTLPGLMSVDYSKYLTSVEWAL
jgi:hypothetical protein